MCAERAYMVKTEHDHSFVHEQAEGEHRDRWAEAGLDFDPLSCDPFYMRSEVQDQTGDFSDMQFFWFSRVEHAWPEMWQIMIEAVVSPHDISFSTRKDFEMSFDLALAIRGKNKADEEWVTIYSAFGANSTKAEHLSRVSVTCPVPTHDDDPDLVCDSFEVGIIGQLDYEMYDVAIMITHTPDKLLGRDFANISFRLSYWNERYMTWFASVRLFCMFATGALMLFYFVSSCQRKGLRPHAWTNFNFEQVCVSVLLFLCALYDDPLF